MVTVHLIMLSGPDIVLHVDERDCLDQVGALWAHLYHSVRWLVMWETGAKDTFGCEFAYKVVGA